MSKWAEIKCTYFNETEKKYYVDAWRSSTNQNEEGKVIAKINLVNETVEYIDQDAKTDKYAQQVIQSFLKTENIKQIILNMIANNKENFTTPFYNHDGYATGYPEGYNDALVDLLNQLGIKHNEEIMND